MEQNDRIQELKRSLLDIIGNAPLHELAGKYNLVVQPIAEYDFKRLVAEGSVEMEELKRRTEGEDSNESIGSHTSLNYGSCPFVGFHNKTRSALGLWFVDDRCGSYSDLEHKFPPSFGRSYLVKSVKPVSEGNLASGELDGELAKLISDNPEFNPQLIILKKLCDRIAHYTREKMHDGFLKDYKDQEFDRYRDQAIHSMGLSNFPSYLLKDNFSFESVVRFEGEGDNYVRNAAILMKMIKREFKRDYCDIKLSQEDQDKLYSKDFDVAYFKGRKKKIGVSFKQEFGKLKTN